MAGTGRQAWAPVLSDFALPSNGFACCSLSTQPGRFMSAELLVRGPPTPPAILPIAEGSSRPASRRTK